jgi:hypothetical protein
LAGSALLLTDARRLGKLSVKTVLDSSSKRTAGFSIGDLVVLVLSGALMLVLRAHAWPAPLETDECNYLYIGQRLAAGDRLYEDVWDHQPPLMFAFMAAMTRAVGSSESMYRSLSAGVSLTSLLMVFVIARRVGRRGAGWLAAVLFALCSSDPGTAGEGGNRELFMNALLLGAFCLLLRTEGKHRLLRLAASGALVGLASGFKTVAVAHWLAMNVWIGATTWHRERKIAPVAISKGAFALGALAVWAGIYSYFAATGRAGAFIEAVFTYNLGYSGLDQSFLARFGSFFGQVEVFRSAWPLWLAGAAGCLLLPWRPSGRLAWGVAAMVAGSYLAVCLPGRFWPHYYYLMVPWLAVCAGALAGRLSVAARAKPLAWLYAAGVSVFLLYAQGKHYYLVAPDEIAEFRYGIRMAWARDQARRVAEVTAPDDAVYVYGSDAGIYYYSGRRCAARFTMIEPISAEREGVRQRRVQFMSDFRQRRPRVVLVTERPFPELYKYLQEHYVPAGMDYGAGPDSPPRMQVLTDKDRPIRQVNWNWPPEADE